MDNFSLQDTLQSSFSGELPAIIGAVLLLLIGWIVALSVSALTGRVLASLKLNNQINSTTGSSTDVELVIKRIVFWFILLVAIVAGFNMLNLLSVSAPFANMLNEVMVFLPRLIAAAVILIVGWVLASVVRAALTRVLASTSLDERISADADMPPIGNSIGQVAYWLILLMFLPMILSTLRLEGLMGPLQFMVEDMLTFVPNIFAAALIAIVGYIIAKIVRGIVTNLLDATQLQSGLQRIGLNEGTNVPKLIGTVVFLVIFVPVIISALDALNIAAVSDPAISMLHQMISALPAIIAATLILLITYIVARFIAGIVSSFLAGTGLDGVPEKINMQQLLGNLKLSNLVGQLLLFFAMLFATVEAANQLNMLQVRDIVSAFIIFGGDLLLGAVILMVGFWLANLLATVVARSNDGQATWLANIVRVLIIGLVLAMGLRAMGIADSIVNLAFGLTLGAIAVAFALAFGLGGREAAGRLMSRWLDKIDKE